MVVEEDEHAVRIRIEEVVRHRHVDIEQTLRLSVVGHICIDECIWNDEGQVEVHDGGQVAVDGAERRVLLPPCRETAAYRIPCLACDVELRIFVHGGLAPLRCELCIHVRMCILADAVDSCILDPPCRSLDEIVAYERIPLVEVRHSPVEPSVCKELLLRRCCVRVHLGPFLVAGRDKCVVEIEPVACRKVLHPPVRTSAMVEDHVHYHLESLLMRLVDHLDVFFHRTEARVHIIEVCDRIAVVGVGIVLLHRVEPDGCHAEVLDVGEVVGNTLDVSAMSCTRPFAVHSGTADGVVGRVAVSESVRSDEVEDVS